MRGQSHLHLGKYLSRNYMHGATAFQKRAFLIGCVQPDKNPVTYLKGSLQYQWLRGHNYPNSQKYIAKLSSRLEKKSSLSLLDHYALGKLIHYTTDAFTFAHNSSFHHNLATHRSYELRLQDYFLRFLSGNPEPPKITYPGIAEAISAWHNAYRGQKPAMETDSLYAFTVCCAVMAVLFSPLCLSGCYPGHPGGFR